MLLGGTRAATYAELVLNRASKERAIADMAAKQMCVIPYVRSTCRVVLLYVHTAADDTTLRSLDMSCHDVVCRLRAYIS